MLKKVNIRSTLIAASIGALVFCIPAYIYINLAQYSETWLLYIGSFLFMIVMAVHTYTDNQKRGENESTVAMVFASHIATIAGVLISCLICFIMLAVLVPGYFDSSSTDKQLVGEPAQVMSGKTDGLSFDVFLSATVINFSVGSFVGIVFPFYQKRNQTRDRREPTPLHQKGTR